MGCAQSRIENEEVVLRCKDLKQLIRAAIAARAAFASSHAAYTLSLKNTGAALSEFAHGEVSPLHNSPPPPSSAAAGATGSSSSSASASTSSAPATQPIISPPPPMDTLPPPPPPLPEFSPSSLHRSISMPEIPKKYPSRLTPADTASSIREEEELELELELDALTNRDVVETPPPPLPPRSTKLPPPLKPQPPPPPPPHTTPWDYFFAPPETTPAPTLAPSTLEILEEASSMDSPLRSPPPMPMPIQTPSPPPLTKPKNPASPVSPVTPSIYHDVASDHDPEPAQPPPVPPEPEVLKTPPRAPVPVKKAKQDRQTNHQHSASTGALENKKGKIVPSSKPTVSLLKVLNEIDEHFLKSSESAREVSKMLEANRMHYHSNFADHHGYIDSSRVMKVITWNKPVNGAPNGDDMKDDFDNDEWETLATVLDKMLAWEKKLYHEVKACEIMKIEYQRKVALFNRQKKRGGTNPEVLEKTKAAVSHLHTRYIVDMQSMDTTVSEMQHLRDKQLHPKLLLLVEGLDKMWDAMYRHHDSQLKIVAGLKDLDTSSTLIETSELHYGRTVQLWQVVREWHTQFQKLMSDQIEFINSLNSWLKLNLIPIETNLKEKVSSPPKAQKPPVQSLLHAWHEYLEKLPSDLAKSAIFSFAAVINTIVLLQQDELKQREKCDEARKEYTRKARAFEEWCHKHSAMMAPPSDDNAENGEAVKDPVAERKFVVESLKKKLDDELDAHQRLCRQVREKSLVSLKTHLPELFRTMSDFSVTISGLYKKLCSIPQSQNVAAAD